MTMTVAGEEAKVQRVFRVLVADDHPHGREGIRRLLSADPAFLVAGEAVNGAEAIELADALLPDLILMDIRMPVIDGLEATRRIKTKHPHMKVVMVTVSDDAAHLFEAIKMGAQGYLLKNLSPSAWQAYLRAVAFDESPISREMAARMLREFTGAIVGPELDASAAGPARAARNGAGPLTAREREVLELVARGLSNRTVADGLGVSENTVKNHLKSIMQKLHLANRVQLARYAAEQGLAGR